MMQRPMNWAMMALVAVGLVAGALFAAAPSPQAPPPPPLPPGAPGAPVFPGYPGHPGFPPPVEPGTLTVTGTSEVRVKPDQAIVRLGAVAQAPQAADAQSQVNEKMAAAIKAMGELGLAKEKLSTVNITLQPVYESPNRNQGPDDNVPTEPRIIAYRAGNTLQVIVDDLAKVGQVIDANVKAGVNQIQSVNYQLNNDQAARGAALVHAAGEARGKARMMARAMDVTLDRIKEVREEGVYIDNPQPWQGMAFAARMDMAATPAEPGEITVRATVVVTYTLHQPPAPPRSPAAESPGPGNEQDPKPVEPRG